jgi:outer membrane receptor protein involved in Fe transport
LRFARRERRSSSRARLDRARQPANLEVGGRGPCCHEMFTPASCAENNPRSESVAPVTTPLAHTSRDRAGQPPQTAVDAQKGRDSRMLCGAAPRLARLLLAVGGLAVTMPLDAQEAPVAGERGSVRGTVLDQATARPIIGARVEVVETEGFGRTDVDGQFDFVLPPGTYRLRVTAPLFEAKRIENVTVVAGATARVSVSLTAKVDTTVEVVEVVADVTAATEATQLLKRKLAPTVSDNLGAETIAKTPDSDAAEVVTRVPAVTIKDDKFVVVRGLNERYSSALLNGSRLPSTDPNKRVVPLDLFPANFIESLSVVKGYTPDLPGDFSGGLVDVRLADPPSRPSYSIGLSTGANTATTFQDFDTYDGSTADWFTLGDDFRGLPDLFGPAPRSGQEDTFTKRPTTPQMRELVGSLPQNWNIDPETAPPNFGSHASVGGHLGPLGLNLSAIYGAKHEARRDETINGFLTPDQLASGMGQNFTADRSQFETKLGAVFTGSYRLSDGHKLAARSLVNRKALDETLVAEGRDFTENAVPEFTTSAIYTVDQLGFGQLEGRHHFSLFDVDWRASWSPSTQTQPDAKFTRAEQNEGDPEPQLDDKNPSALRSFSTLDEFLEDYYVDVTVPFGVWSRLTASLKWGVAYSLRDRTFEFRRFKTSFQEEDRIDTSARPDDILIPENYSASGPLRFVELSVNSDNFEASQEIAGVYGMLDVPLIAERLRFVGGVRTEYSYLVAKGATRVQQPVKSIVNDLDPLPSANLIYTPIEDMNVRLGFSQTVSRPEFRELTPTQFPTLPGQRTLQGNPFLTTAHITSYDLRWEWFFSPLELVSASFFYKMLKDPIELITVPETSALLDSYLNADEATVYGFEFELRKDFNFLVPRLRKWEPVRDYVSWIGDVQFVANAGIIESEVTGIESDDLLVAVTNDKRQLQGQAPFVVNASIEYEHYRWGLFRMLYNTVGRTLKAGGVDIQPDNPEVEGLDDLFQERRDQLDFVWIGEAAPFGTPVTIKFAVENILNDDYVETQGPQVTNRYFKGQTFTLGVSYAF